MTHSWKMKGYQRLNKNKIKKLTLDYLAKRLMRIIVQSSLIQFEHLDGFLQAKKQSRFNKKRMFKNDD